MKSSTTIRVCLLASLLSGSAVAQQLSFNDFSLVAGNDMQRGATYRFYNVTSGVDAVIKVDNLSNASLGRIDDYMSMDNERLYGAYFTGVNTPEIVTEIVPEPSSALLALIGAATFLFRRNRKS